jgi:hypothetical protein
MSKNDNGEHLAELERQRQERNLADDKQRQDDDRKRLDDINRSVWEQMQQNKPYGS